LLQGATGTLFHGKEITMPELLSLTDLEKIGITYSPLYLHKLEAAGQFPKRVRIGKSPMWPANDVREYVERKIAARTIKVPSNA
jgi:predicted DNA-binding transcriptional regulator AlpA